MPNYQRLASSCSHLVLPHSEKLIQASLDLTKSETRTLQTACAIICLLAHFQKNKSRYATFCGVIQHAGDDEQQRNQKDEDQAQAESIEKEQNVYSSSKNNGNASSSIEESPRKVLAASLNNNNNNNNRLQLLRHLLLSSRSSSSSSFLSQENDQEIFHEPDFNDGDIDDDNDGMPSEHHAGYIPEPPEIIDALQIIELALKIPGRYMVSVEGLKNDKIQLSLKLYRSQQSLISFYDMQLASLLSLGGIQYCEEVNQGEEDIATIDFEDEYYEDVDGVLDGNRNASSSSRNVGARSMASLSQRSTMTSNTTTTISILPSRSVFSQLSTTSSTATLFSQQKQHRTHQIVETSNEELTKILNGGLRVGTVTEICCGKDQTKLSFGNLDKRRRNNDDIAAQENEDLWFLLSDENERRLKSEEFDSVASIITALNLIPSNTVLEQQQSSSSSSALRNNINYKSAAVVSLSSRATNLFLDCVALQSGNNNKNEDSIVFEEFFPGLISTNGGRTLLEYLPVLEAKMVMINDDNNKNNSENDDNRLKILMLLDIDAAISSLVTSVDVIKNDRRHEQQQQQVHQTAHVSSSSTSTPNTSRTKITTTNTDSIGEVIFPELKKLAVRQNVAVVVVRLKDSNDLMVGTSALLNLLSSTFGGDQNKNNTKSTNGSGGDVASYHAVNCRLRATRAANQNSNSTHNVMMSIEVCKSSWCGMSVSKIKL